jgi:hypothetical protein
MKIFLLAMLLTGCATPNFPQPDFLSRMERCKDRQFSHTAYSHDEYVRCMEDLIYEATFSQLEAKGD